jgi:E1A/CREB-binding protein
LVPVLFEQTDYYNMMKGPVEPQLQFAIKTLSAQNQHNQQNPQMARQIASSSSYGTMIPTPGMTQGTNASSRIPYVTENNGLSSSGAGMVPQNANMGASMQGAYIFTSPLACFLLAEDLSSHDLVPVC